MDDREARELVGRIEALLGEVEGAEPLIEALLALYGEGLRRIVAAAMPVELARDEVIGHLLLLHGLHPEPLAARVGDALDEVTPYLASHGGGVELLGVQDGVVRLALEGTCNGCPSSSVTLKLAIEEAIHKHAPDVERVEAAEPAPTPGLLQLEVADTLRVAPGPCLNE
jgi:Fe-S cluster biogenesis protein NfuA